MEQLEFYFQNFEGPMDLLIHLIEKDRIDIYDIPVATLADQFLDMIDRAQAMNLEVASSFLLFASTLVSIKVKMLLPKRNEDGEDPRQELVDRIIAYKFYKEASSFLIENLEKEKKYLPRKNPQGFLESYSPKLNFIIDNDTERLWRLLEDLSADLSRSEAFVEIKRNEFSLDLIIEYISDLCHAHKEAILFQDLYKMSPHSVVVLFLALLECVRLNYVSVNQEKPFGDIYIHAVGS